MTRATLMTQYAAPPTVAEKLPPFRFYVKTFDFDFEFVRGVDALPSDVAIAVALRECTPEEQFLSAPTLLGVRARLPNNTTS